jgi:hypothetical protein
MPSTSVVSRAGFFNSGEEVSTVSIFKDKSEKRERERET